MDYLRPLTPAEQMSLRLKADRDKTTITEMLDAKIAQYLVDVERDNGTDVNTRLAKKLEPLTDAQKEALVATL